MIRARGVGDLNYGAAGDFAQGAVAGASSVYSALDNTSRVITAQPSAAGSIGAVLTAVIAPLGLLLLFQHLTDPSARRHARKLNRFMDGR